MVPLDHAAGAEEASECLLPHTGPSLFPPSGLEVNAFFCPSFPTPFHVSVSLTLFSTHPRLDFVFSCLVSVLFLRQHVPNFFESLAVVKLARCLCASLRGAVL